VDRRDGGVFERVELAVGQRERVFDGAERPRRDLDARTLMEVGKSELRRDAVGRDDVEVLVRTVDDRREGPPRAQSGGEHSARVVAAGEIERGSYGVAQDDVERLHHRVFERGVAAAAGRRVETDRREREPARLGDGRPVDPDDRPRRELADAAEQRAVAVDGPVADELVDRGGVELRADERCEDERGRRDDAAAVAGRFIDVQRADAVRHDGGAARGRDEERERAVEGAQRFGRVLRRDRARRGLDGGGRRFGAGAAPPPRPDGRRGAAVGEAEERRGRAPSPGELGEAQRAERVFVGRFQPRDARERGERARVNALDGVGRRGAARDCEELTHGPRWYRRFAARPL
jgi:hypothetical protein